VDNSAHYYMECSNKGVCDRETGECQCFDGYDGAACQRASCPGYPDSCSGHGVCKTISQLAAADYDNIYELWDRDVTMGCECDAGFYGPDCSMRECKYGVDPLYIDDSATIKYSTYNFAVVTTSTTIDFTDGQEDPGTGHWAIRFYDMHGEDWLTKPLEAGASCSDIIAALNELPNDVIPEMSEDLCTDVEANNEDALSESSTWQVWSDQYFTPARTIKLPMAFWESSTDSRFAYDLNKGTFVLSGNVYRLHFFNNPGAIREPEIEIYLDGKRPSITSPGGVTYTRVWTDGQQGESVDHIADHCDGVRVTLQRLQDDIVILNHLSSAEEQLLKACLGPSDFDSTNNVDIFEWDHGSYSYPHLIKLVRTVTQIDDGGYYAALIYDSVNDYFRLLNPMVPDDGDFSTEFEIYTTKGTLALTSSYSNAVFGFAGREIFTVNRTYDWGAGDYTGDISCESTNGNGDKFSYIEHCLNKDDLFTFLTYENISYNAQHMNLYTAKKLYQKPYAYLADATEYNIPGGLSTQNAEFKTHTIVTDISTNWANRANDIVPFHIYKFFPSEESSYEYVAQCSNRGLCDTSTGICDCFGGYTGDSCSDQNSLAV